ncbi:MAG TPA: response regulator [Steroidobacteraceae bacterium]|jgi:PAS domain S-box-containing protein|nr:response regulator [Steroidobacteraceae bacterium]
MSNNSIATRSILNAINGGLVVLDRDSRVLLWNVWMRSASGIPEESATGRRLTEIFPEAKLQRLSTAIAGALTYGASTIITHVLSPAVLPLHTRSRQPLLHDIAVSPIGQAAGPNGCVIVITDVTAASRRVRYLRDQQDARYDAVVASAPDIIITVDAEGLIQFANPAARARFGGRDSKLVGTDAALLFETQREWASLWRGAIDGTREGQPNELIAAHTGGELRYFEASASRWKSGARLFATVILRDVTERRAIVAALRHSESEARNAAQALTELNRTLEERVQSRTAQLIKAEGALRHSQKMEAIGNLTGSIAHDFNNLLHVISGNLHLLKRDVSGNAAAERRVQIALDGVARSAKLSSQLLAFARRQPLSPKVINLGHFIRDMEDIIRRAVGEGVAVETAIGPGLWNTLVDPGNVENALLNMAINARDAMDGQGRLTIETANILLDSDYAAAHEGVTRGEYVMVAVSDTGSGMSAEVIEQAFEPFFTTKPEGRGTGLGLSMVYGFVRQSGGHIQIHSEVGRGSTLKCYLPRSMQSEDVLTDEDASPVTGGSEMILVAEDDEHVRETVVAMLTDLGYRVLKARDAQSALSIIESGMPLDLLFTDVIMPGPMKSTEMARKARERMPNLAVLFTSGYTEDAFAGGLGDSVELLSKPYSREALARKLRHMLANAAQRNSQIVTGGAYAPTLRTPSVPTKPIRILVCEDNIDIRDTTVDMLSVMGHHAMSASDARTALSILTSNPIDILLTDVGLPDMPGTTLASHAKSRFPALDVIFATGEASGADPTKLGMARTLVKPFTFDQLAAAIRERGQ